jgi:hypothetical protein
VAESGITVKVIAEFEVVPSERVKAETLAWVEAEVERKGVVGDLTFRITPEILAQYKAGQRTSLAVLAIGDVTVAEGHEYSAKEAVEAWQDGRRAAGYATTFDHVVTDEPS